MYKSVPSLSLLLFISSLIMLVPFTSINFSNVNAQEYGAGSYDYDVDDSFSKYPTEVNKYECRTGPFEGFFVSSVEFCKHLKFDKDSRDNKTGTQGPPGPPGPQGPQGPPGIVNAELCPAGTDLENVYVLNGTTAESCNLEPEEPNATLAVTKNVTCSGPVGGCSQILSSAPPSSFNIVVTGNNPNPSEFAGSNDPVVVTLGAGNYEITEDVPVITPPAGVTIPTLTTSFDGDCTSVDPQSTEATGTIEAGESQICDISNDYSISSLPTGP